MLLSPLNVACTALHLHADKDDVKIVRVNKTNLRPGWFHTVIFNKDILAAEMRTSIWNPEFFRSQKSLFSFNLSWCRVECPSSSSLNTCSVSILTSTNDLTLYPSLRSFFSVELHSLSLCRSVLWLEKPVLHTGWVCTAWLSSFSSRRPFFFSKSDICFPLFVVLVLFLLRTPTAQ